MTDEQINQRIAEACGWRKEDGVYMWTANGIDCTCPELWDWANDLNAMHEAEKGLEAKTSIMFGEWLLALCNGKNATWHATARQHAEAFLRTLGKWDHIGDATEMVKEVQK